MVGEAYNDNFYYVTAVLLLATVTLTWLVRRSRFGLQLLAIRDDEDRARGLGVRVARVKLTAFVLSAIPVGMAGGDLRVLPRARSSPSSRSTRCSTCRSR